MAAIHHDSWYDGTPASIGLDTTAEQWEDHRHYIIQKIGKKKAENTVNNFGALGDTNGQM